MFDFCELKLFRKLRSYSITFWFKTMACLFSLGRNKSVISHLMVDINFFGTPCNFGFPPFHYLQYRLHVCKLNKWEHYGTINDLSSERPFSPNQTNVSNTSPTFTFDIAIDREGLFETGKWKQTYMRAHHLQRNWATGRYRVAPLLKAHGERVTCIDCDGKHD